MIVYLVERFDYKAVTVVGETKRMIRYNDPKGRPVFIPKVGTTKSEATAAAYALTNCEREIKILENRIARLNVIAGDHRRVIKSVKAP